MGTLIREEEKKASAHITFHRIVESFDTAVLKLPYTSNEERKKMREVVKNAQEVLNNIGVHDVDVSFFHDRILITRKGPLNLRDSVATTDIINYFRKNLDPNLQVELRKEGPEVALITDIYHPNGFSREAEEVIKGLSKEIYEMIRQAGREDDRIDPSKFRVSHIKQDDGHHQIIIEGPGPYKRSLLEIYLLEGIEETLKNKIKEILKKYGD